MSEIEKVFVLMMEDCDGKYADDAEQWHYRADAVIVAAMLCGHHLGYKFRLEIAAWFAKGKRHYA